MTTETLTSLAIICLGVSNILQAIQTGKLKDEIEKLKFVSGVFIHALAEPEQMEIVKGYAKKTVERSDK